MGRAVHNCTRSDLPSGAGSLRVGSESAADLVPVRIPSVSFPSFRPFAHPPDINLRGIVFFLKIAPFVSFLAFLRSHEFAGHRAQGQSRHRAPNPPRKGFLPAAHSALRQSCGFCPGLCREPVRASSLRSAAGQRAERPSAPPFPQTRRRCRGAPATPRRTPSPPGLRPPPWPAAREESRLGVGGEFQEHRLVNPSSPIESPKPSQTPSFLGPSVPGGETGGSPSFPPFGGGGVGVGRRWGWGWWGGVDPTPHLPSPSPPARPLAGAPAALLALLLLAWASWPPSPGPAATHHHVAPVTLRPPSALAPGCAPLPFALSWGRDDQPLRCASSRWGIPAPGPTTTIRTGTPPPSRRSRHSARRPQARPVTLSRPDTPAPRCAVSGWGPRLGAPPPRRRRGRGRGGGESLPESQSCLYCAGPSTAWNIPCHRLPGACLFV